MLTHRGFSAWIEVDGEPLQEFMTSLDEEGNVNQCFIAGEEGSSFIVHWKDHDTKVDSVGFVSLDGYTVPGRFLFGTGETHRSGARVSQFEERPFKFLKAPLHGSPQNHYLIGTIKLSIKRIRKEGSVKANEYTKLPIPQMMKGNELAVGFGQQATSYEQYAYTWGVKPHPDDDPDGTLKKPPTWVTFIFKYRTRDWLREQGLIPMVRKPRTSVETNRVVSGSGTAQTPMATSGSSTPRLQPRELTSIKKSFGDLGRGGEKVMPSALPSGAQRTASGRVVSVKPGSVAGAGILCFDEDMPTEDDFDDVQSPPQSVQTDSSFLW